MRTVRRHIRPVPVVIDGIHFPSTAEAKRYGTLRLLSHVSLEKGGIQNLSLKPKFPMVINGVKIGSGWLKLDFQYEELRDTMVQTVYEDVKSVDTRESKIRRRVCEAIHGITIKVVKG